MRLIDADALIEETAKWLYSENEQRDKVEIEDIAGCVIETIKEQPTAYDIERVCEELDSAEYPFYLFDVDGCDVDESLLKADIVESIVRRGGIDG